MKEQRQMLRRSAAGVTSLLMLASVAGPAVALEGRPGTGMLVVAHRGASVYAAESSMLAYSRAADLGADLLEGDLMMSKDGRLVLLHDLELSRVTDIAVRPEFAARQSVRNFNGVDYAGWWVDEFTWDELATLRTPDGQALVTLDELVGWSGQRGATLYMELKESDYFAARGLDLPQALANLLIATGRAGYASPFWIQSANPNDLARMKALVGNRTVFLTRSVGPEDVPLFPSFRQFADVLSVPTTRARRGLVAQAHAADLGVHVWTLRGSRNAYRKAASIGADGVITDFPDLGVDVRSRARVANRPTGLSARLENGNVIVNWASSPGTFYAVTFDFGDPLEAPTLWVQGGAASYPLADAKTAAVTVAAFDGSRLSSDAFAQVSVEPLVLDEPRTKTRVGEVSATVDTNGRTRVTGSLERLKGSRWVPLRRSQGWLRSKGDDVEGMRRSFTTDKKGEFSLTVQIREDIISGYVPERAWRVGVTATKTLKPSSSSWVTTAEGSVPQSRSNGQAQSLPQADVRVRG
jgi:glycerophosphoryl diester phosphodiesterase